MQRLANFDISSRFRTRRTKLVAQLLFGLACALGMIVLRSVVDLWAPTSGAFALVYPTVLLATLYGHWRAGLVAYAVSFVWAWYVILPAPYAFHFEVETDPSRVLINAIAAAIVLIFAETFRRAVEVAVAERDVEIERRGMLLAELEHRTKNNFALVASLLQIQKRREKNPAVSEALDQAVARVHTFASAYANLASSQGEGSHVLMHGYLNEVVGRLKEAAFTPETNVSLECAQCELPRQTAVAIALFVNEALTNCAKYAFPDGRQGSVHVNFEGSPDHWSVTVSDDGVGNGVGNGGGNGVNVGEKEGDDALPGGLGSNLMTAFARQAGAEFEHVDVATGHAVCMRSVGE